MTDRFTSLSGVSIPIVQAPMSGAVGPALAAAVSNAGGLGTLPLWGDDLATIVRKITQVRGLTDRTFAVNLNLNWPQHDLLRVCLDEGVTIISLFWGNPAELTKIAHDNGAIVMHTVASANEARRAIDCGVDIIVAQGVEAGGHVLGTVSTMALVPAVVDAVSPVPVIAAGGISDGRGMAAALALGASGVWVGTRYLASPEAEIHEAYRTLLLNSSEDDTEHSVLFDIDWPDAPHRAIRNSTFRTWHADGRQAPGERPGEGDVIGTTADGDDVVRYQSHTPRPDDQGDVEAGSLWCGQGVGLVQNMQAADEITREIWRDAQETLRRLGRP